MGLGRLLAAPGQIDPRAAQIRRWVLISAALNTFGILSDRVMAGHWSDRAVAARLVLTAVAVPTALLFPRVSSRTQQNLATALGLTTTVSFYFLVLETGGRASPLWTVTIFIPLVMGLVFLEYPAATLATGVASFLAMTLLVRDMGWSGLFLVLPGAALAILALSGSLLYLRSQEALQQSERRRMKAERWATVGQLAGGVAHEVNNPLAFVTSNMNYLQAVLQRGELTVERANVIQALEETRQGLERIRQIVSDLSSFARESPSAAPEPCPLAEVVAEASRLASVRFRNVAEMRIEIPTDLPPLTIDRRHLVQVLVNVLVNAADAHDEARRQGVAGERWVRVAAAREGRSVRIDVEDNGPGIPPDILGRLGEPFITTKPPGKGAGLGLALSQEYLERMSGSLEATNRPEGGARLTLRLPVG